MMIKKLLLAIMLISALNFYAQEPISGASSTEELAKKIQNPVASLISIPFQNNYDFGKDIRPTNTLNIQPVVPFKITKNINLITRTIIPIISAPVGNDRKEGIGNINFSAFFTPAKASKLT